MNLRRDWQQVAAALVAAPVAALAATFAVVGALPVTDSVRLGLYNLAAFPAMAAAPCAVLLCRNGARAWASSAFVFGVAAFVLFLIHEIGMGGG